jgi:NAD(P)-dependent dehydrogenase (short-subunit alcohol dehydrogenase family)
MSTLQPSSNTGLESKKISLDTNAANAGTLVSSLESTAQAPISSGFGYQTTAGEVIAGCDLSGKTAIVTGGASGIGVETTRALASAGAHVIVLARDIAKTRRTFADIEMIELATVDLADPTSIDTFAERFLASERPLHLLINNAGVMFTPFGHDKRGYETQFATNHLGHFQLAVRLWPALQRANGARIISVSSRGHRFSQMNFDDPHFDHRPYDKFIAYGQSKTANILFAIAADSKGRKDNIRAFALHPGRILATNLTRFMSEDEVKAVPVTDSNGQPFTDPAAFVKSVEQGAATSVWCAVSPQLDGKGAVYCEDCDIAPVVPADDQGLGVRFYAIDPDLANRLWTLSEQLTGVAFGHVNSER